MKIFIGNLSTSADEKGLITLFGPFGKVMSASIVYDQFSHRSRGCGYVDMEEHSAGVSAIGKLNNTNYMKQSIIVREAGPNSSASFGKKY